MNKRELAFHGNPRIQAKYVNRVEGHYVADEFRKGVYWHNGKGCAIGCMAHSSYSAHQVLEDEIGLPSDLGHEIDYLFEDLPNGKAKDWPLAVITSIPLGADLSDVANGLWEWQRANPTARASTRASYLLALLLDAPVPT